MSNMSQINILTKSNPVEWNDALKRMIDYDFYHTYSYNNFYTQHGDEPVLFCFKNEGIEIILPLIVRKIDNSEFIDVTSAYGYVGPLSSQKELPSDILIDFSKSLIEYFKSNKTVSVFSRMHPSFENDLLIGNIGEIIPLSQTVYIDLTQELSLQKKQYRKGVKSDLSKLNREGYELFEDTDKEFIDEFIEIYNENMLRVEAKEEYFFDRSYYDMIFNSPDINSKLYFVVKDGIKVAASIFVFTDKIIQYHLSATRGEYLHNSPVRLLIDHVRIYGTENGYKELHLGGGLGSSEDSLFNFKAGFSKERHQFKIWKYIVNQEAYDSLVKERNINNDSDYFPLYRAD